MPTPDQILAGLAAIANRHVPLAMAWHAYFAVLLWSLGFHRFPGRRATACWLILPLLSVSALAWGQGNPFNGMVLLIGAVVLAGCAWRLPAGRLGRVSPWGWGVALPILAFGWGYPHFLDAQTPLAYLYAAPLGLVPCPTLAMIIGITLLLDGLDARPWSAVLAGMGGFYGLFGALYLDVALDWGLVGGALLMTAWWFARGRVASRRRRP